MQRMRSAGGSVIIGTAHIPSRSARTTVCQKALKLRLVKKASPPITSPKASIAALIFHAPPKAPISSSIISELDTLDTFFVIAFSKLDHGTFR